MSNLYSNVKSKLFADFKVKINYDNETSCELGAYTETLLSDRAILTFEPCCEKVKMFEITAKFNDNAVAFYVNAVLEGAAFNFEKAISFKLGNLEPEAILGSHGNGNPIWMTPTFNKTFDDLADPHHSLLMKDGSLNWYLLSLTGDNFRAESEKGYLHLTSDFAGLECLSGAFAVASLSSSPYDAIDYAFKFGRQCGAIRVPLKHERTLPEHFKKFGWCTWDAFYGEVCEEKIFLKLEEFKKKNIPVKWVIIDDGWLSGYDSCLCAYEEQPEKFPNGLKATIKRMKEEYGIEKVGVWHAFLGYWCGIHPQSPLYEKVKEYLYHTPQSCREIPSLDEEKGFKFWDGWHSYLKDCGVDFLKIDNQSSTSGWIKGSMPTAEGCRHAHNALERSIIKNFDGAVINCMGMNMENVLARPITAVSRNSDDFFPKDNEKGFVSHCNQNAYNALWHGEIYYCDYDMWWTNHEEAVRHGVLRAIAGSPIYVSDELDNSNIETLLPVIEDNGDVMYCDDAARPTLDCIYTDCRNSDKPLKVFNRSGENFAVAAFNLSENEVSDKLEFDTIPGLDKDCGYVAYEYFTKKYTLVNNYDDIDFTLAGKGVAVWSLYPIVVPHADEDDFGTDAYIMMGSTDKYVPIASKNKTKVLLCDIPFEIE